MVGDNMRLKIMNYNIMNGFYDNLFPNPTPKYQKEREEAAKRAVKDYDPDILVIPEACLFRKSDILPALKVHDSRFAPS
ncbi:hypothetical protein CMI42_03610 [Candidatus Pacearchaeota archaeon]|nr:hypothetical protein [Candidatus Pacearchaeota archaeon]